MILVYDLIGTVILECDCNLWMWLVSVHVLLKLYCGTAEIVHQHTPLRLKQVYPWNMWTFGWTFGSNTILKCKGGIDHGTWQIMQLYGIKSDSNPGLPSNKSLAAQPPCETYLLVKRYRGCCNFWYIIKSWMVTVPYFCNCNVTVFIFSYDEVYLINVLDCEQLIGQLATLGNLATYTGINPYISWSLCTIW